MDTDSLYLALAEKELTDCIRSEMKAECENMRSTDCDGSFAADASGNFFPEFVVRNTENMTGENRVSSEKNSSARKCCVFLVKIIAATILPLTGLNSAAKVSISANTQNFQEFYRLLL